MRNRWGWHPAVARTVAAALSVFAGTAVGGEVYVGGAVGQADVRFPIVLASQISGAPDNGRQYAFDRHATAWKVLMGARPTRFLGIEMEYIDFGHPGVATRLSPPLALPLQADVSMRGPAAFAVGYLPLPLPLVSVYGKVGGVALHSTVNATDLGHIPCLPGSPCSDLAWLPSTQHVDHTVLDVAYGAGVSMKIAALAVRLEYERVSQRSGDPDLLSLGVSYSFQPGST
jgi:hypothetical protein